MKAALLTMLALGAVGTCALLPFEPSYTPELSRSVEPSEMWVTQYHEAETCSGHTKKIQKIHWHIVPGKQFSCPSGQCIGWTGLPNDIYIADAWKNTEWVARHEAIHAITGWGHDSGVRDTTVWGRACRAMWGWLESPDSTYRP